MIPLSSGSSSAAVAGRDESVSVCLPKRRFQAMECSQITSKHSGSCGSHRNQPLRVLCHSLLALALISTASPPPQPPGPEGTPSRVPGPSKTGERTVCSAERAPFSPLRGEKGWGGGAFMGEGVWVEGNQRRRNALRFVYNA